MSVHTTRPHPIARRSLLLPPLMSDVRVWWAFGYVLACLLAGAGAGFAGCGGPGRQDPDPEPADCKKDVCAGKTPGKQTPPLKTADPAPTPLPLPVAPSGDAVDGQAPRVEAPSK